MLDSVPYEKSREVASRVIKRYSNRKLYDTQSSKYVTLLQIAEMVRAGDEVRIVDNRTKEDKTEVTLALIISEELKNAPGGIPLNTLRALIRHDSMPPASGVHVADGGSPLAALVGAVGSFFLQEAHVGDQSDFSAARARLEQWQAAIDERVRALPDSKTVVELQGQVRKLGERLAELERRLGKKPE